MMVERKEQLWIDTIQNCLDRFKYLAEVYGDDELVIHRTANQSTRARAKDAAIQWIEALPGETQWRNGEES